MPFAVIDFETTRLVPERTDRAVEVDIALTDDGGGIQHEWTTLVNPHRDVGPRTFTVSGPGMSRTYPILPTSVITFSK